MILGRNKIANWFESIQTGICIVFLALMSLIVIVQVFSRYIFNFSFVWAEELVRYLMIWMVMLGSALVQAKNEHIRIDFFPMLAGARGRRVMEIFFRLATLVFLVIITFKGFKVSWFNQLFESSGLRISMLWPTLAIPLGAITIGSYTVIGLALDLYQLFAWSKSELKDFDRRKALEKYRSEPQQPSLPQHKES
jgi:TRAP-type C4-dicarboxylate transport system permease small subunit